MGHRGQRSEYSEAKRKMLDDHSFWDKLIKEKLCTITDFYFDEGEVLTNEQGTGTLQLRNELTVNVKPEM